MKLPLVLILTLVTWCLLDEASGGWGGVRIRVRRILCNVVCSTSCTKACPNCAPVCAPVCTKICGRKRGTDSYQKKISLVQDFPDV
ncbi:uncharacterized protein LOC134233421 [Saccostrea cucullata]|uniref:uncharacterized protein LOC134233421 n=1 Tax=Saccostrea cuccullata TaxID=36930 RepID=UPI002ED4BDE4